MFRFFSLKMGKLTSNIKVYYLILLRRTKYSEKEENCTGSYGSGIYKKELF